MNEIMLDKKITKKKQNETRTYRHIRNSNAGSMHERCTGLQTDKRSTIYWIRPDLSNCCCSVAIRWATVTASRLCSDTGNIPCTSKSAGSFWDRRGDVTQHAQRNTRRYTTKTIKDLILGRTGLIFQSKPNTTPDWLLILRNRIFISWALHSFRTLLQQEKRKRNGWKRSHFNVSIALGYSFRVLWLH